MLCWLSYEAMLKWSVRLDSHQHLPDYEPDALTVKLQTKMVGYPGAAPGLSWSQTKRVRWLSRIR